MPQAPQGPARRLVLVAGPSGSGKSRLVQRSDVVGVRLDDFYADLDSPGLPRRAGMIDWDDVGTFLLDDAAAALAELLATGRTTAPDYDISQSRRVGSRELSAPEGAVVVAEGIFAPDLLAACRKHGIQPTAIWLDRPRPLIFLLRLRRDVREHRKPLPVLLRRGLWLAGQQRDQGRRAVALGFRALSMRQAEALVDNVLGSPARRG